MCAALGAIRSESRTEWGSSASPLVLCASSPTADNQDQDIAESAQRASHGERPLCLSHSANVSFTGGKAVKERWHPSQCRQHSPPCVLWCGNLEISSTAALLLFGRLTSSKASRQAVSEAVVPS